jgi:ABC-type phosphate/phosphonate transport system permease subunit
MLTCSLQQVVASFVTMSCIVLRVVPSVALGLCFVNVWMIPIVRLSLALGFYMLG